MTRSRAGLVLALAATVAALLPSSATASPVGVEGGLSCGLTMIGNDGTYSGVLAGGPFVVAPDASATMRCWIQAVHEGGGTEVLFEAASGPQQGVVTFPLTGFTVRPSTTVGLNFEVCTEVTVYDPSNPTHVISDDADHNPMNGWQCPRASSAGNGVAGAGIYVKPQDLLYGPPCIWAVVPPAPPMTVFCH